MDQLLKRALNTAIVLSATALISAPWVLAQKSEVRTSPPAISINTASPGSSSQDPKSAETIGVTDKEIVIGSCLALTGQVKESGHLTIEGVESYLNYVNDKGGIYGRKIKLVTADDGYDPEKAMCCFQNTLKDHVFAGAFFLGSAPITKYVRLGEGNKMPLFGLLAGAPAAYEFRSHVFVVRPSYKDEMTKLVQELLNRKLSKIALVYQADAFGAAIRSDLLTTLKAHGMVPSTEITYTRDQSDLDAVCDKVAVANPQAIVVAAAGNCLHKIVERRNLQHWSGICVTVSSLNDYIVEMGKPADGFIISQVVPSAETDSRAAVLYRTLHKKYFPTSSIERVKDFEAFLNAEVLVEGLRRAGPNLTRSKFVKALESMHDFDLGLGPNYKVNFSANSHVGWSPKAIWLAKVRDGKLTPLSHEP